MCPVSLIFTLTDSGWQLNEFFTVALVVSSIAEHLVFYELIIVPLTLERWAIVWAEDAFSMFASVVPITIIAVAILVIDFALSMGHAILPITIIAVAILVLDLAFAMCLAIEVAVAFILAAFISPLPDDESINESSFDHGQVWKNQASSSMRLVVLPVALIQT